MKKNVFFIFLLALIACASGQLLSKASWVGRVGMTFFYKEYNFMKVWWQGAIAIFLVFLILFLIHSLIQKKMRAIAARLLHIIILFVAGAGAYLTYDDFTNNFSHRILGRRFHYGFYLFWIGWGLICFFFIFKKKRTITVTVNSDKTEIIKS